MDKYKWLEVAKLENSVSNVKPSLWPNDKYPEAPQLKPKSTVVVLDEKGPGVVTNIHVTRFSPSLQNIEWNWDSKYIKDVIIRIFYDNEKEPSINLPLCDFLGDVEGDSSYFSTKYFSKVKRANNFRLPIPFRKHIKIEIENPTLIKLSGYMDIQFEKVKEIPDDCGYLYIDYRRQNVNIPDGNFEICDIKNKGSIIANWLQFECDDILCKEGEVLCEGNNEFYIDNEKEPSIEYLGTEDYFGFSWGFNQIDSDGMVAILKKEVLKNKGSRIALMRCRDIDKINFQKSCRAVIEYKHEINKNLKALNASIQKVVNQGGVKAKFVSCIYYYTKNLS